MDSTPRATPRRLAALRAAAKGDAWMGAQGTVTRSRPLRYRDEDGTHNAQATIAGMVAAGLLEVGRRPARPSAPRPLNITDAGRAVLASWEKEAASDG